MIRRFWASEAGATSIEYAFVATLIGVVIVGVVGTVGTRLNVLFSSVATGFR